ncbi:MAG TPA: sigma 54-interacting transcriptional regulator, partial [Vicinamibacteria bacterium]
LPHLLIVGETGTGKGLLARALHDASPRQSGPFVDINCAAIPENLIEAELFGVERGAYTGADRSRRGLFQAAHKGTLFLDEIALAPASVQGKLLRALEERTVRPLGSTRAEAVDTWILAATNEDLREAIAAGRFRRDLYHRLAVLTLRLPPLRERGADMIRLAEHFLARACTDYGLPPKRLAEDARAAIVAHDWPGNVRELANVIERVALLSQASVGTGTMLQLPAGQPGGRSHAGEAAQPRPRVALAGADEAARLREALEATGWNLSQAAERLSVPRNTLRYRMERHGLREPPPSRRPREAPGAAVRRRLALLRVGLSAPSAPLPAADAGRLLDAVAEKVQTFGGRIEQVAGAALAAVFGLEPIEDAPRRAALAAMAARKAVERSKHPGGSVLVAAAIDVRECGVTTPARGVALDEASRQTVWSTLETLATGGRPDDVLVSEAGAAALRRRFDLVPTGARNEPAGRVYRLTGRERTGFGPADRMTEFVGRDQELAVLQSRLASAVSGRGQVVAILGEAGIGKSRLLFELRQHLVAEQVAYLEGRCMSYGREMPYLPMLDIVRQCLGIAEGDTLPAATEKLQAVLGALHLPDAHTPYLLSLLGVADAGEQLRDVNPSLSKTRTFEAIRALVSASARRRPLVLAIEDLHWIDKTSDEV